MVLTGHFSMLYYPSCPWTHRLKSSCCLSFPRSWGHSMSYQARPPHIIIFKRADMSESSTVTLSCSREPSVFFVFVFYFFSLCLLLPWQPSLHKRAEYQVVMCPCHPPSLAGPISGRSAASLNNTAVFWHGVTRTARKQTPGACVSCVFVEKRKLKVCFVLIGQ